MKLFIKKRVLHLLLAVSLKFTYVCSQRAHFIFALNSYFNILITLNSVEIK